MQGKIIKGIAGFYYVHVGESGVYECKAKGSFRNQKVKPLVGDNVRMTVLDEKDKEGNIEEILPRKNELIRPAVANVDHALVIFAAAKPKPNFNLLDRFLILMQYQQVPAVVCFNKQDLAAEQELEVLKDTYISAGYEVRFTSAATREGVEEIRSLLKGRTTTVAGPSGVGKSSLTNRLFPEAAMETGDISQKIKRGRHTTRHSELFSLGNGTYLMDTPGFSSMYIEDMEADELKNYFPEFSPWEDGCRFLGCVHMGEKVCGVKEAVAEGKIGKSRYENYRLMYQELKDKRRY